jgi:endonuclease YncB( thermonuclease family)
MPKKVTPIPKPSHPRFFFREWRKYRGLNQEALAEIVGVTTSTISQAIADEFVSGTVLSVSDGDTFTIRDDDRTVRVRLCGIDSPERGQPGYALATGKNG